MKLVCHMRVIVFCLCILIIASVFSATSAVDFKTWESFSKQKSMSEQKTSKFPGFPPSFGVRSFIVQDYFKINLPDWMTWEVSGDGSELNCDYSLCVNQYDGKPKGQGSLIGPGKGKSRILGGIWQMSGVVGHGKHGKNTNKIGPFSTPIRAHPALAIQGTSSNVMIRKQTKDPGFIITGLKTEAICDLDQLMDTQSSQYWNAEIEIERMPNRTCANTMSSYIPPFPANYRDIPTRFKKSPIKSYEGMKYPAVSFNINYNMAYFGRVSMRLPYQIQIVCVDTLSAIYIFKFETHADMFKQLHPLMESALISFEVLEPESIKYKSIKQDIIEDSTGFTDNKAAPKVEIRRVRN